MFKQEFVIRFTPALRVARVQSSLNVCRVARNVDSYFSGDQIGRDHCLLYCLAKRDLFLVLCK